MQRLMKVLLFMAWSTLAGPAVLAASHQSTSIEPQEIRIGVLALRGRAAASSDWDATGTYLTQQIAGYRFVIQPLDFDEVEPSVAKGELDFVIVNPAIHVALAEHYMVSPVATMINRLDDYNASLYGGVIFRRAGASGVPELSWLKDKRFVAVSPRSLGGFLAAWRELNQKGINPYNDFKSLEFVETHDAAVLAVLQGKADAGTARTDVLERMAAEGKINLSEIEVIGQIVNSHNGRAAFPYLRSTRLYPEWPISKTEHVPDELAKRVAMALLSMSRESEAAQRAEIVGWNVPMSYIPVVDLLQELHLHPFEPHAVTLLEFLEQQKLASILIVGGLIVTGMFVMALLISINRLRRARVSLEEANERLEERVRQRTEKLEASERALEAMATHDPLTGLLNRRALETRMLDEVNRANRYGQPMAVLMLDIDFFKKINDTFGHLAGDLVLRELARLLNDTLRNTDTIARYGGEEFVILLPMTERKDAVVLAERLRDKVAKQDFVLETAEILRFTISVGVASTDNLGCARSDILLDLADRAMYAAKQAGRNQVQVA